MFDTIKNIRKAFGAPYEVGTVIAPFLFLSIYLAYEAIYILLLELWCLAYGLIY
jgi:hypothetical protein